jgi:hypothetical protein
MVQCSGRFVWPPSILDSSQLPRVARNIQLDSPEKQVFFNVFAIAGRGGEIRGSGAGISVRRNIWPISAYAALDRSTKTKSLFWQRRSTGVPRNCRTFGQARFIKVTYQVKEPQPC